MNSSLHTGTINDAYTLLGLQEGATPEEIKVAYETQLENRSNLPKESWEMFAIQSPEVALLRAKYLLLDTTKTQVQDRVEEIIPQEVNSEPSQEDILHDQNLYQACIHEIASIKERSTSRGLHVPLNNYDVHQILQTIDTYTKKQRSHIQSLNFYTLKLHYLKLQRQIGSTR